MKYHRGRAAVTFANHQLRERLIQNTLCCYIIHAQRGVDVDNLQQAKDALQLEHTDKDEFEIVGNSTD